MKALRVFPFLILINSAWTIPLKSSKTPSTCSNCHPLAPGKINIHLVPHSHDDVGWLKTVDQYYYGGKSFTKISDAGVQYIIGSSIQALNGNPDRRYIQVESAFFWKWWQAQSIESQQNVVKLLNNGQLEIVNGAWSMNDEAATNYQSIIDQFTWGFRFLNESMGECARPKVGWQIDPFGHSREHASLLTQFGFEGLVIGRLDYRDKNKRLSEKNLDFMWTASANLNNSNIFTTMFPNFYISPDGFCFDITCYRYDAIVVDKTSPDYNLDEKVNKFARLMDTYKNYYKTPNILIPMGGDFTFQAAEIHFKHIDNLIAGFKDHPKYNLIYSTPWCYVRAVNEDINKVGTKLTQKTDDFFPFASESHGYWTGYFSSRPTVKRFERVGNNILQASKQLTSFSRAASPQIKDNDDEHLQLLREAMGILQHHDAITGTEKQAVANNYVWLLMRAIQKAEEPIGAIFRNLLQNPNNKEESLENDTNFKLSTCLLANVSICEPTSQNRFIVAVYNPLSRPVTHYVRLPVDNDVFSIRGPDGVECYDLLDPISNFEHVKEKNFRVKAKELVFKAANVPPLGAKFYFVEKGEENACTTHATGDDANSFEMDNKGRLKSVTLNGRTIEVTQEFAYYTGSTSFRSSGAYVFRPRENSAIPINTGSIETKVQDGKLVKEVVQVFNGEARQIIRMYKNSEDPYLEFDWLVGNLQKRELYGAEIVSRFQIKNIQNNEIFYTDSNGREQIERKLNSRLDYSINKNDDPVSGNYYPITSKIVLKDENANLQVAVLTDRSQGGSSLKEGEIELMVHRQTARDDGLGVDEVLKEMEYDKGLYARGQHYLTFGPMKIHTEENRSGAAIARDLAQKMLLSPWVLLGEAQNVESFEDFEKLYSLEFFGLTRPLPENVQILTLEPWVDDTLLLRLEHTFELNEDAELSKDVEVDLKALFSLFDIVAIGETTLGGNEWMGDFENEEKMNWMGYDNSAPHDQLNKEEPLKIKLSPMQIRTFIIKVVAVKKD